MPLAALPDAEIHYEIVGDGPPVVLVAGLGGAASYWRPNVAALAAHHTVILYDHRGCGRSTRSETAYSVEGMAEDLLTLMDRIGLDRVSLIGHSTGGAIGQILAARAAPRIDRLVLYASWAELCPQMEQCMIMRRQALQWGGAAAYHRASPLFLYPPRYTCESWAAVEDEMSDAARHSTSPTILDARIEAVLSFDGTRYLPDIRTPTTVLVAQDDILTPPLASHVLASGIRGARLVTLPYGAHAVSRVDPAAFDRAALEGLA